MTAFGAPRRHLRVTDSTNERARELALAGAPGGTVVTADEQTDGPRPPRADLERAVRQGASVFGDPGAARASPRPAPAGRPDRGLRGGRVAGAARVPRQVAERRLVRQPDVAGAGDGTAGRSDLAGDDPGPRWRKLAGVLIEARPPDWAVIGIGLNLAIEPDELPTDLRRPATSVGHGVGQAEALAAVCERLGELGRRARRSACARSSPARRAAGARVSWEGAGSSRRAAVWPRGSTSAATCSS